MVYAVLRVLHVVQVYHMPGSSDNFVTAFRAWLNKYGGGGPFGPMDERWLQVSSSMHSIVVLTLALHRAPWHSSGHRAQLSGTGLNTGTGLKTMLHMSAGRGP